MNKLMVFESNQFGQVRTITCDGEPWFVAADVCRVLEHSNPTMAVKGLDDDEKRTLNLAQCKTDDRMTLNFADPRSAGMRGGAQSIVIINEPGLYQLVIRSNKPEAKAFKRWITHEVIPAIRRTGGYIAGEANMTDEELLSKALMVMQEKLSQRDARIQGLTMENSRLTVERQIMAPKAEYFDELVDRNLLTGFRETAKELGVKEKEFVGFLIKNKYIYRDKRGKLMPYAERNTGLFEVKECMNDKTAWAGTQTMITPKGRETFRLLTQGMAG